MSLIVKRNPDGRLYGRDNGQGDLFLLARSRRVANRKSFEVRHYMVPSLGFAAYALKGLSMSMLHDPVACTNAATDGAATLFGLTQRRSTGAAKPVHYEGKTFLVCPNIQNGYAHLVNEAGQHLAGSNIFDDGHLCLGSAIDVTTLNAVDALCFNTANRDLQWMGAALVGEWERNPDPDNPRSRAANQIFRIATWPTWIPNNQPQIIIPPQILEAVADW